MSPASGSPAGGTGVTITGTGLSGATGVSFGGTPATVTADSGTQVTATSPPGKGTVDITVTTPVGASAATAADNFTYAAAPPPPPPAPPMVTGVSPPSGSIAGGTGVTITGTGLSGATGVSFGGTPATVTADSGTQITVISPPGKGTVDITVTTPAGTSAATAADNFAYYVVVANVVGQSQAQATSTLQGQGLAVTTFQHRQLRRDRQGQCRDPGPACWDVRIRWSQREHRHLRRNGEDGGRRERGRPEPGPGDEHPARARGWR